MDQRPKKNEAAHRFRRVRVTVAPVANSAWTVDSATGIANPLPDKSPSAIRLNFGRPDCRTGSPRLQAEHITPDLDVNLAGGIGSGVDVGAGSAGLDSRDQLSEGRNRSGRNKVSLG